MVDKITQNGAKEIYQEQLLNDATRKHILSIVDEYANSVQFMEKVRKYAGAEIDSRLFTSLRYWLLTIVSAAIAAIIGVIVTAVVTT